MALVSDADLAKTLMRRLNRAEIALVNDRLVPDAEADLRAFLNRDIEDAQEHTETLLLNVWHRDAPLRLFLSWTPVKTITSVSVDGNPALDARLYATHFNYVEFVGLIGPIGKNVLLPGPLPVEVVYTTYIPAGGADAYKAAVHARVLRQFNEATNAAAQEGRGEAGLSNVSVEGYSYGYNSPAPPDPQGFGGFLGTELAGVSRYRRRVVR